MSFTREQLLTMQQERTQRAERHRELALKSAMVTFGAIRARTLKYDQLDKDLSEMCLAVAHRILSACDPSRPETQKAIGVLQGVRLWALESMAIDEATKKSLREKIDESQ